ncbi:MAG TPA: FG-GAP repeat protein [Chitinophagaceae bacterium]|jgi:hypothetical protein|nr:FG-GAP repeat protein [Chitinophagaceae bacterium]
MKIKIFLLLIISYPLLTGNLFAQNVGVGTGTPAEKLHVAGNIRADTIKPQAVKLMPNAGAGKILTSDAFGNASWQSTAAENGNTGFGVWGDCATNGNISEYNPVASVTGAADDMLGYSVSISGNFAIIGAYRDDIGVNANQGSASIYQHNGSDWIFLQKITDATGAAGDCFGFCVSIDGNYAIVGAPFDEVGGNSTQGSVSIYQYNGSAWVLMQKLTDATGLAFDRFGQSVSISGNYAIAGAPEDDIPGNTDQGSASIYHYNGSSWVYQQKMIDPAGDTDDAFGSSVSIDGDDVVVGSPEDDVIANNAQGSSCVYHYTGTSWAYLQKLTDPLGAALDIFGSAVSISGNYIIAGAHNDDDGANSHQGSACIFWNNGTSWVIMQKITDPGGEANDDFGKSVAISGNYAFIGAWGDEISSGPGHGSVSIFIRVGPGWQRLQKVTDPGGTSYDNFSFSVAIDKTTKRFLIGAYGYAAYSGKAVFGKIR